MTACKSVSPGMTGFPDAFLTGWCHCVDVSQEMDCMSEVILVFGQEFDEMAVFLCCKT